MAVTFEMRGDERDVLRALAKAQQKVAELEGKVGSVGRAAKTTEKHMGGAFDPRMLTGFVTALTGTGGVLLAMRLITAELEKQKQLQTEAKNIQITLAGAQQELLANMPAATARERRAMLATGGRIAMETGVSEPQIALALAQALSAGAGQQQAAIAATALAARYKAHAPEAIPQLAGALLDLSKVTGTTDPAVNFGYLTTLAGMSRVVSPRLQSQNIPRALISTLAYGGTARGAGALFAALTSAGGEVSGEMTGTTMAALAGQLASFWAEQGRRLPIAETMMGRIAALQADPRMAQRFIAQATFERKQAGLIRQLMLEPTSDVARTYQQMLGVFPTEPAELARRGQEMLAARGLVAPEATAEVARILNVGKEAILGAQTPKALAGAVREQLPDILAATGIPWIGVRARMLALETRTGWGTREGALRLGIEALEQRRADLMAPPEDLPRSAMALGFYRWMERGLVPAAERPGMVADLGDMIGQLRRVLDRIETNTRGPVETRGGPGVAAPVTIE
jgi:hypothetical protein